MSKLYSGDANDLQAAGLPPGTKFVHAGYMAAPLKGQWYLSGAKITAYRAPNALSTEHVIAYAVQPASAPGFAHKIIGT